jgi:hypothetical protein
LRSPSLEKEDDCIARDVLVGGGRRRRISLRSPSLKKISCCAQSFEVSPQRSHAFFVVSSCLASPAFLRNHYFRLKFESFLQAFGNFKCILIKRFKNFLIEIVFHLDQLRKLKSLIFNF